MHLGRCISEAKKNTLSVFVVCQRAERWVIFFSAHAPRLLFSVKKRPFYGNGGAATSPWLQQQKNVRELFAALPAAADGESVADD